MLHHEKFFSVCLLVTAIILCVYAPAFFPSSFVTKIAAEGGVEIDASGTLRILDIAVGGLLLALGNATGGQRSSTEQANATGVQANAEAARDVAAVAAAALDPAATPGSKAPPPPSPRAIERAVHDGAESGVAAGIDRAAETGAQPLAAPPPSMPRIGFPDAPPERADPAAASPSTATPVMED